MVRHAIAPRLPLCVGFAMLLSLAFAGCASQSMDYGDYDTTSLDAAERAILMNNNFVRARQLFRKAQQQDDATAALTLCEQAMHHYDLALKLDSEGTQRSSRPYLAAANCLSEMATLEFYRARSAKDEKEKEAGFARANERAAKSNRLFQAYVRTLYQSYPNPMVFETIGHNYQILEQYDLAADAYETFVREAHLKPEDKQKYQAFARRCRDRAAASFGE